MSCPMSGGTEPAKEPDRCLRVSLADREYVRELARTTGVTVREALAAIIHDHRLTRKVINARSGAAAAAPEGGA